MNQIICQKNDKIFVNGNEIKFPKKSCSHKICQVNNRLFVDGYEYVDGKWKKTIEAVFRHIF